MAENGPTTSPDVHESELHAHGNLIPMWLAVVVLVLLLAVMAVGGYVIRGVVAGDRRALSPQETEVVKWRDKVRESPLDSSAHLGLGYAYQNAGRYDKALDEYATVLETDPADTAALYNRGIVYLKLDVGSRAEASFWEVLEAEPSHVLAAKALGEYYTDRQQYRSALKALSPAAEAYPQMADIQYLMGLSHERLGHPVRAIQRYRLALKYAPDMQLSIEGVRRLEDAQ